MAKNNRLIGSQTGMNMSDQEVWLAIRYLDPDDSVPSWKDLAVLFLVAAIVLLVLTACAVCFR
jgi:hypothetical protein